MSPQFEYAPLWCKSNFSFLTGASHPDELMETAQRHGVAAIGMSDRDGVYGVVRAHLKAREVGVALILGAEVTVAAPGATLRASPVGEVRRVGLHAADGDAVDDDGDASIEAAKRTRFERAARGRRAAATRKKNLQQPLQQAPQLSSRIVLLASNRTGWTQLTRLLTAGRRRSNKGESLVTWDEVAAHAAGNFALWGGTGSLLAEEGNDESLARVAASMREAFGDRLYAMLTRHRQADDVPREQRMRTRATQFYLPTVAANEVLYHHKSRRQMQDVLTCIRHRVTLATAGRLLQPNDEHELKSPHMFAQLWHDDGQSVRRTLDIAAQCNFRLDELRYRYPSERLPDGSTSAEYLRHLVLQGVRRRYGGELPDDVVKQVNAELSVIETLDYPGYFLTMYEIVQYCERNGILCQGRGSAANSAVCYCLGITAIDPVRMNFLFERFLSLERAEPPDIDLDIEHERREEVIQHVYRKYGRDHAAMVCNLIRYRARSAVRDVGFALGMPETGLDRAAKLMSSWGDLDKAALTNAGLQTSSIPGESSDAVTMDTVAHLAQLATEILEFPRHISIHPGGFLLGHEPVHDLVPIENGAMADRTVIQWDKDDIEALGLFKVDLLALGALHLLHRAFDLIREHRGEQWTLATVPDQDEATYDMICTADTIGTIQIESRAQMSMLPRLKPRVFYDLVIQVSIVRPGPISGGMVHPYLRRRNKLEPVVYPHPCLEPVLRRTEGVPLFQEQVMKLAVVAADYTPGEADQLRRDMAAWRRSGRIEQHRERLITRMGKKGIALEFAERVFEQIRGFGEYGFPESHAASFALIAYATSWLRCHYLPEFIAALLNAQPMGFYSPSTIIGDAQRHALEVRGIDVQHSAWDATLEPVAGKAAWPFAVRMGLRWIKGLSGVDGMTIVRARADGPFASIADFSRRTRLGAGPYAALAQSGALGNLGDEKISRRDALWQLAGWSRRQDEPLTSSLDDASDTAMQFAPLTRLDAVIWDYQRTDHSTTDHPLGPMRATLRAWKLPDAGTVKNMRDGQRIEYVGLVICRQRPATAAGVTFLTLEDETGFVNVVVWQKVFEAHEVVLRTCEVLGIFGQLQIQEGIVHLVAERAFRPQMPSELVGAGSRDFH